MMPDNRVIRYLDKEILLLRHRALSARFWRAVLVEASIHAFIHTKKPTIYSACCKTSRPKGYTAPRLYLLTVGPKLPN